MDSKMKLLVLMASFLLTPLTAFAGSPSVSSFSGIVDNGETINVNGQGFGVKRTPADYDYFDSVSDWTCNRTDGSCLPIPNGENITWQKVIFNGDENMMNLNGHALYNIDRNNSNYSTGRAWNEWPEYYTGGVGGLPNGSMGYHFNDCNEIFYVYYTYYDPRWPQPYDPIQDKNVVFWLSVSDHKITGAWAARAAKTQFEVGSEAVSVGSDMMCSTCFGDYANSSQYPGPGRWIEIKVHLKMNTWTGGSANADGIVQAWIDGVQYINDATVVLSDTEGDQFLGVQLRSNWSGNTAQLGFQPGEEFFVTYDDVLINYSSVDPTNGEFPGVACVYLSDQSTWGSGPTDKLNGDQHFVRQKVGGSGDAEIGFKSWSDNQFKYELDRGAFPAQGYLYLYVFNWDGEVNQAEHKIWSGDPVIFTSSLIAYSGVAFDSSLEGGGNEMKWALTSGALPVGLHLESDGRIHGVPGAGSEGSYSFTVVMTDQAQNKSVSKSISIVVNASAGPGVPVTIMDAYGRTTVTVTSTFGDIDELQAQIGSHPPDGYEFPYGLFQFTISNLAPGGREMVEFQFQDSLDSKCRWYKFDTAAGKWNDVTNDLDMTFVGANAVKITITDGGVGDSDGSANGQINDPSGPAVVSVSSNPSNSSGGGGGGGCFISALGGR
jgi:hypothetical protein